MVVFSIQVLGKTFRLCYKFILRKQDLSKNSSHSKISYKLELLRVMTSIYEALTIKSVLECHKRRRGYLKIWYLYVLSTIQLLQVMERNTLQTTGRILILLKVLVHG